MKQQYELYLRIEFFFKVRYFLISFKYEKKDNILALQCWPIHRNTNLFFFHSRPDVLILRFNGSGFNNLSRIWRAPFNVSDFYNFKQRTHSKWN